MATVVCIMMQKNEGELLRLWIEYHRCLFGEVNLYIFDNNSTDELTMAILDKYQDDGISINKRFNGPDDHVNKGAIFGELIKKLEISRNFDFVVPLDCDEFLVSKTEYGISCDRICINKKFDLLLDETRVLSSSTAFYNVLGRPDHFFAWPQTKSLFRSGTFEWMDSGFHNARSKKSLGRVETDFAYIHMHHKPYDVLVEHSKNKIRPYFDPDDISALTDPKNKSRLTDFILMGEENYMNKFKTDNVEFLPEFQRRLTQLGLERPF